MWQQFERLTLTNQMIHMLWYLERDWKTCGGTFDDDKKSGAMKNRRSFGLFGHSNSTAKDIEKGVF